MFNDLIRMGENLYLKLWLPTLLTGDAALDGVHVCKVSR